jgi:hypothetical protein
MTEDEIADYDNDMALLNSYRAGMRQIRTILDMERSYWPELIKKIEQLKIIEKLSQTFVSFVENNMPHMKPDEVSALFWHLEWEELRDSLNGKLP